ncbi:hypothetical protein [Bosea sp. 685]|uniref:hypothetical protein n=1 Tax=Bosea sp. 685 TaxID=3080057 RepID=UPI002892D6F4|nr:hypothetical protein [Bosea sp. 685]WNJ88745.1 hypothetical protein RMR04_20305 [Bosea sp. 685]
MSRIFALVALAGLAALSGTAAQAQYYDPYGRPPPPRYDYDRPPPPRDWEYERRRPRYEDDRGYRPRRFGEMCVTSRGSCETRPAPVGAGCGCYIDGFGSKRGIIQ